MSRHAWLRAASAPESNHPGRAQAAKDQQGPGGWLWHHCEEVVGLRKRMGTEVVVRYLGPFGANGCGGQRVCSGGSPAQGKGELSDQICAVSAIFREGVRGCPKIALIHIHAIVKTFTHKARAGTGRVIKNFWR